MYATFPHSSKASLSFLPAISSPFWLLNWSSRSKRAAKPVIADRLFLSSEGKGNRSISGSERAQSGRNGPAGGTDGRRHTTHDAHQESEKQAPEQQNGGYPEGEREVRERLPVHRAGGEAVQRQSGKATQRTAQIPTSTAGFWPLNANTKPASRTTAPSPAANRLNRLPVRPLLRQRSSIFNEDRSGTLETCSVLIRPQS